MNSIFNTYEAFIFDLDGVIWLGSVPIPGAVETIEMLQKNSKKIRFLTNNACDHREKQYQKLLSFGIEASFEQIMTAGSLTAKYILKNFGKTDVHVMGSKDLEREMTDVGHSVVSRNAKIVVTGLNKDFNWDTLNLSLIHI